MRLNIARLKMIFTLLLVCIATTALAYNRRKASKAKVIQRITTEYAEEFTSPERKHRKTFSQFGYNLYYFSVPLFPITKFIKPDKFGYQSYGRPNRRTEKNGSLYTCKGGFMDFSHIRTSLDWTVYLTFKIYSGEKDFDLPGEAGTLHVHFNNTDKLTDDDIASMAQKIAFERLVWHEVASWHYHKPYHKSNEQQSTFTPEDIYSNMLGTTIGKSVALRILRSDSDISYSQIATEEIQKTISSLQPVGVIKQSKRAYDIVDRNKQCKLPEDKRNKDIWYDSRIIFRDQRYVFKRSTSIGPEIAPWLVPNEEQVGCPIDPKPATIKVPEQAHTGKPYYDYYTFTITPDTNMFYDAKTKMQYHQPFTAFTTKHYAEIISLIEGEMEEVLGQGFNKRDANDPVPGYKHIRGVLFK